MFIIFPDSTTMLFDCGDHAAVTRLDLAVPVLPNPGRLVGDWVHDNEHDFERIPLRMFGNRLLLKKADNNSAAFSVWF